MLKVIRPEAGEESKVGLASLLFVMILMDPSDSAGSFDLKKIITPAFMDWSS